MLAHVFDVSARSFDTHIRPLAPADAVRGEGKTLRFYGAAVVQAWAVWRVGPAAEKGEPTEDDPSLVGSDSPQLERWRRARADLAELDLEQRRGDLVDGRDFNRLLLRFTRILRGCGETLQRQYGIDAQGVLDEGIDEIEREIDRHFAAGDEGSPPPVGDVTDMKGG